jgi:hypothetical protein
MCSNLCCTQVTSKWHCYCDCTSCRVSYGDVNDFTKSDTFWYTVSDSVGRTNQASVVVKLGERTTL